MVTERPYAPPPQVIGVDLSLSATGLCRADGSMATVGGPARLGDWRLVLLHDALEEATVAAGWPSREIFAIIEDLPTHAMSAGLTGRAQGVARQVFARRSVPVVSVVPSTLKKLATGSGATSGANKVGKVQMREAWEHAQLGAPVHVPADDNQVDAWWLRQIGLWHLGVAFQPAGKQDSMEKIDFRPWDA